MYCPVKVVPLAEVNKALKELGYAVDDESKYKTIGSKDDDNKYARIVLPNIVIRPSEVTISTHARGTAGTMSIKVSVLNFVPVNGSRMICMKGEMCLFDGFLGSLSVNRQGEWTLECHDMLFYLMANVNYFLTKPVVNKKTKQTTGGKTAGQVVEEVCERCLRYMPWLKDPSAPKVPYDIVDTKYVLNQEKIWIAQKGLDIINYALVYTAYNDETDGHPYYILYSDGGTLYLKRSEDVYPSILKDDERVTLGVNALMGDYTLEYSITEDTANTIVFSQPNEKSKKAEYYVAYDLMNIAKWGTLMRHESIDAGIVPELIKKRARQWLLWLNHERKKCQFNALGIDGLRGGSMIVLAIPNVPGLVQRHEEGGRLIIDNSIAEEYYNRVVLVNSVTHTYTQSSHTMSVEVRTMYTGSLEEYLGRAGSGPEGEKARSELETMKAMKKRIREKDF
jgi:hypothetical protein